MAALRRRTLGRSGIEVSALGMGCWAIGGPAWRGEDAVGWGKVDDRESARAIAEALELGVTFFDTADVYGAGHSERVLGKALAGRRPSVVIATKFGNTFTEGDRQLGDANAAPDYVRKACEASLRRLGTDRIDLYQFHLGAYDPQRAPEVRETLEELVGAGKIRAYGWSTDLADRAQLFAQGPHCTSVQNRLNVMEDAPEVLRACAELRLASINRGPLAMGLLTGKYTAGSTLPADDVRGARSPSWMRYFAGGKPGPEWLEKIAAIREILTSEGRTLAQGAIAWIWARSPLTIPIPGFKTIEQVRENAGAMERGPLTSSQVAEVDRILGRA
jgi:aryl-alcohol dehydrogenase-like predicted oxidoreductase